MDNYKPNSHKSKTEKPERNKLEKVVKGKTTVKKKSTISKFASVMIYDDIDDVKATVISDVLIPALKKTLSDIVTTGIDMLLYGESTSSSKRTNASRTSYHRFYDDKDSHRETSSRFNTHYYDDIILESRKEAEEVLNRMDELMDAYQVISVADYFDLCDVKSQYTDCKYGWTNLKNASVVRVRNGYMIKLPKPLPID